jgi:hypothetical protein
MKRPEIPEQGIQACLLFGGEGGGKGPFFLGRFFLPSQIVEAFLFPGMLFRGRAPLKFQKKSIYGNNKRKSIEKPIPDHHQGIISPPRRDLASGVAFPPEAGKRSLLSFDLEALDRLAAYCSIRLSRRSLAPCI